MPIVFDMKNGHKNFSAAADPRSGSKAPDNQEPLLIGERLRVIAEQAGAAFLTATTITNLSGI